MNTITRKANANALRQVETLYVLLFEGEVNAHKFVIEPVEGISFDGATIVGTFLRADNQRVQVETGAVVDGNAEITLTAGCYAVPGRYRWTIYMVTADETACIYAACGTVQSTQGSGTAGDTEPIIEPTAPDLTPIENRLSALETILNGSSVLAAQTDAAEFNITQSHQEEPGDFPTYNHMLYARTSPDHDIAFTAEGKAALKEGAQLTLAFDTACSNWGYVSSVTFAIAGVNTTISKTELRAGHVEKTITVTAAQAAAAASAVISILIFVTTNNGTPDFDLSPYTPTVTNMSASVVIPSLVSRVEALEG